MRSWVLGFVLVCGCGSGASDDPYDAGVEFVATDSDFANFQSWTMYQLPDSDPLSDLVYPIGSRRAFLNRLPPPGAMKYPIGTVIVKAIEIDPTPADWEIFAMTKRGDDFNPTGALDWEFFILRISAADGQAHIVSRGTDPTDDARGDMGLSPAAGGYFDSGQITPCNVCHGQTRLASVDFMLGTQLVPAMTAAP